MLPARRGAPGRARRSARPSAAAADRWRARVRSPPAALRRPTAPAAARRPGARRQARRAARARGVRPRPPGRRGACTGARRDVVERRQVLEQAVGLEHHPDRSAAASPRRASGGRPAPERPRRPRRCDRRRTARGRRSRAGSDVLPDAGRAHQRHELARRDGERRRRAAPRARRGAGARPRISQDAAVLMASAPSNARFEPARQLRPAAVTSPGTAPRRAAGHHPAAEVGREDLRLLGQFDDRQHRDERRVLQQRDEVVGHRRAAPAGTPAARARAQHLAFAEAERPRRLELARRARLRARRGRSRSRRPRSSAPGRAARPRNAGSRITDARP